MVDWKADLKDFSTVDLIVDGKVGLMGFWMVDLKDFSRVDLMDFSILKEMH